MDQFASANGVAGHALMLDCRTLAAEAVALPPACAFLVVDSMVRHAHASGAYRLRREECERAARALGVAQLRDVRESDLKLALHDLDEAPARRARHVVTEIARVREAAEALRASDLATLGRAMNASHASLRDDMAVSIPEPL
jgi:galactokinase